VGQGVGSARLTDRRAWRRLVVATLPLATITVLAVMGRYGWAAQVNDPTARFLVAVTVALVVCQLLGVVVGRLGQPRVVGEVIGGIALGPSLLGWVWPAGRAWLFTPPVVSAIGLAAQLGLAVFMFLLGCELRTDVVGQRRRVVTLVVVGGMGLPFVGGVALAAGPGRALAGGAGHGAAILFLGLALAITAVPVLARMLPDLKLERTPVGTLALAAAAVGDGVAWLALALILAVAGPPSGRQPVVACLGAAGFVLLTVLWVRPLLARLVNRIGPERHRVLAPALVAAALAFAAVSQLVGLHVVVGAFLFGAVMPRNTTLVAHLDEQVRGFAVTVLLPLFFVGIGLSTSVALVGVSPGHLALFAATLVVAVGTKVTGAAAGARLAGLPGRDALRVGALMNCRGVTELVVASIGYQYHLVNQFGLTVLVLAALATTVVTTPVIHVLDRVGCAIAPIVGSDMTKSDPVSAGPASR
jgi:Kef-type K+ transport system membrane component KefB